MHVLHGLLLAVGEEVQGETVGLLGVVFRASLGVRRKALGCEVVRSLEVILAGLLRHIASLLDAVGTAHNVVTAA